MSTTYSKVRRAIGATRRRAAHPFWQRLEAVIDPFSDTARSVLPTTAWAFILYFAQQARGPFILLLVMGGLVGGVDVALYWAVGYLVDLLESSQPDQLLASHGVELGLLLVLVMVVRVAVLAGSALVEQQVIIPSFYSKVRWQSFRRVIEQPYSFYQNDFAGRIATKIMQAGESVGDFIITALQSLWSFLVFVVLTTTILTTLEPRLGVVLLLWGLGYAGIVRYLLPRLRRVGKENADERSLLNGRLVDVFTNIMAVKLFDNRRREQRHVRDALFRYLDAVRRLTRTITAIRVSVALLNSAMMGAIAVMAIQSWMANDLSTGAIASVLGLVFRLNHMSGWMMFNINGLVRAFSTVQDAVEIISVQPTIRDSDGATELARVKGEVRFEAVRFGYHRQEAPLFNGLSLTIQPGEKVGLVGPSGAGKSTLIHLLLRLYDLQGGKILLDGVDIRAVTQASLREQFGVVSQEPSLLHRSLRDNIAYGRPDASEEEIHGAAQRAQAHDFIIGVEDPKGRRGYSAHVGERGIKLSGGQRQRVAIARVILRNAPILILDEATSALDSEIEAAIQDNLAQLMEGKTVLAVAHRLSTIAALDRLIVMDGGRIVEMGSHEELVARPAGLYARLWRRQSGGFLV